MLLSMMRKMPLAIVLLSTISCGGSIKSPTYPETKKASPATSIDRNGSLPVVRTPYHPGGEEYKLPTNEERRQWNNEQYNIAVIIWAKQRLVNTYCKTCRKHFDKCEIEFIGKDGENHHFEIKCNCNYNHKYVFKRG